MLLECGFDALGKLTNGVTAASLLAIGALGALSLCVNLIAQILFANTGKADPLRFQRIDVFGHTYPPACLKVLPRALYRVGFELLDLVLAASSTVLRDFLFWFGHLIEE